MGGQCRACYFFSQEPHGEWSPLPGDGLCLRFPRHVGKHEWEGCGEFRRPPPDEELLSLPVNSGVLGFDVTTQRALQRLRITTVADVCDLGPAAIKTNGYLDRRTINDIRRRLAAVGVAW